MSSNELALIHNLYQEAKFHRTLCSVDHDCHVSLEMLKQAAILISSSMRNENDLKVVRELFESWPS